MEDTKLLAKEQGVSVNQLMATVLAERVGEMKAMARLRTRASSGDTAAALAILQRAPDIVPLDGDSLEGAIG
jgi:hypothetical protein